MSEPAAPVESVEDLKARIAEVKKANEEKRQRKEQLAADCAAESAPGEQVKDRLRELHQRHVDLSAELAHVQKQDAELHPAYERCLQNKDVKDRATSCRKTIDEAERQLAADSVELAKLAQELELVGRKYEDSVSRKQRFSANLKATVEALAAAVRHKLATAHAAAADSAAATNPAHIIDVTADLVDQRERELRNSVRILRESRAIAELKRAMEKKLEEEITRQLAERKRLKDENIKELVYQLQEERNTLQADIDEVRRINESQAENLTRGHVQRRADPHAFAKPLAIAAGPSSKALVLRDTKFAVAPVLTPEEQLITAKNAELVDELKKLTAKVAEAGAEKTELSKALKAVQDKLRRDADQFSSTLQELEAKVVAQVAGTRALERENCRASDTVQHLTANLTTTKRHIDRIRGNAVPLPIEE